MKSIKDFFRRIFGRKNKLLNASNDTIEALESEKTNEKLTEFEMKIQKNNEKIKLFQMFRKGEIKEELLTIQQKEIIKELYKEKIDIEKRKIQNLTNKIMKAQRN